MLAPKRPQADFRHSHLPRGPSPRPRASSAREGGLWAAPVGADRVELYTEPFAAAWGKADQEQQLQAYAAAAQAALEIQSFVRQRKKGMTHPCEIRIGLHSGQVVAGIVGVKKFAYDIWGDTVNTAARMESSSEPGKINLSGTTYALLKDAFDCDYRGKITAKNKGEIDMYFLKG